jgi:DNA-binding CsgD family transcriptional regulator
MSHASKRPAAKDFLVTRRTDAGVDRLRLPLALLLAAIAVGGALDLWMDWPSSPGALHVSFELAVLALSLAGVAWLGTGWVRAHRSLDRSREASVRLSEERDHWRARAEKILRGLGEEIDAQLRRWNLTAAERQVAVLLLKGYGHKEIAALLERSERTIRQHAVAIYRKSDLSGRAELAAFFLEDLLLPAASSETNDLDRGPEAS